MTIHIVVKHEVSKGAPGFIGRYVPPFKAGQRVVIGWIPQYINKPTGGEEKITRLEDLSFWTGADIDYGLIFDPEEIAEVLITEDDKNLSFLREVWPDGPITVKPNQWWMTEKG